MGHQMRLVRERPAAFALVIAMAAAVAAQTGRVSGTIREADGEPIPGATLLFEHPDAPNRLTATSDSRGRYSVIGMRSGEWSVSVQAPGYEPQAARILVRQATPSTASFTLTRVPAPPPSALGEVAPKDLQAELREADRLFNAQRWDEAIAAYQAILARSPALSVVNLQLGAAYRGKKDYDNALAAYQELLKSDPGSDKARVGIALTNMEKGDLASAEEGLTIAAQTSAAGREVFYSLGEIHFAKGDLDEAVRWYQRAAIDDPNWGKPLYRLGLCALNKGDREGATRMFEQVIAVDPTSAEALEAKRVIDGLP
jgi:Flp pilus assembly protein TadD